MARKNYFPILSDGYIEIDDLVGFSARKVLKLILKKKTDRIDFFHLLGAQKILECKIVGQ